MVRAWESLQGHTIRGAKRNADLIGIWLALLVAQHQVPVNHPLSRGDLLPWMVLTLSVVAFVRARSFGHGPHPMLTPRVDRFNALLQRAAASVAPWALLYVYDAAYSLDPKPLGFAVAVAVAVVVLVAVGGSHGQTAWNPRRGVPIGWILGACGALMGAVGFVGYLSGRFPDALIISAVARGLAIGLSFLTIGLMAARAQNHRQRLTAGRKDGKPYKQQVFPAFLGTFGPFLTLTAVFLVVRGLTFSQAFVLSLLIVVWAGVVWPKPLPIMVSCVLHEVVPTGGRDPRPKGGQANAFDMPPEGALRFHPLKTKRTLVMHPWLVPVRSSRIAELDDPVRPLWDTPPPLQADHVLGDAAFEPDPATRQDQWDVITVRLKGRSDVGTMKGGDGNTRRMVILRAFPAPGTSSRSRTATYRWENRVPEESVQVLDPTTETATLRDGDILVISSEGVARAFQLEIGAPIYRLLDANAFRPPQLEDYVEV